MTEETIMKLKEEGYKEISAESIRNVDYEEIIEYYEKGVGWKMFGRKVKK